MRTDVQFAVIDTRLDTVDDIALHAFHAVDQVLETPVAGGVGPGNVRRIAVHLCSRVDQEGT